MVRFYYIFKWVANEKNQREFSNERGKTGGQQRIKKDKADKKAN